MQLRWRLSGTAKHDLRRIGLQGDFGYGNYFPEKVCCLAFVQLNVGKSEIISIKTNEA